MKVAIVRGGFEGVAKQHSIWRLEVEVENDVALIRKHASMAMAAHARRGEKLALIRRLKGEVQYDSRS